MDNKITKFTDLELRILALYLSDYNLGIHVREISRLLKKNHRTISLALKKLDNKSIMIYKNIGKSKQYFLNFNNILTKEYIKNAESFKFISFIEKNFTIKKLLNELYPHIKFTPIAVFGSYAKREENKESDLDILIINKDREILLNKIKEFSKLYKIKIHIQKFTQKQFEQGIKEKDNLIIEIMHNHIILNNIDFFVDVFWRHYHAK